MKKPTWVPHEGFGGAFKDIERLTKLGTSEEDQKKKSRILKRLQDTWKKETLDLLAMSIEAAKEAGMSDREVIDEVAVCLKKRPKSRRIRLRSGSSGT